MPQLEELTSELYLTIDGSPVQSSEIQFLMEATVDQHTHLPDMFTLRFHDPELKLLDSKQFDLTKSVKIEAVAPDGKKITLIDGEITALEPEFEEGMIARLVVRGYDKSFRLYRQARSIAHQNKKDSDLAEETARTAGLKVNVDSTPIVYDHIYQCNQSDLSFLLQRARRIGYECFVSEGTLFFRKPPVDEAALKVAWGEDLLSFQPCMTLAEQVDEVIVKGWNADNLSPIVGKAEKGSLYPRIDDEKDGAAWARAFGAGRRVIVDQPVNSQAEADALAAARLDEISGSFLEAHGVAYRRPDLRAGRVVNIEAIGERFSGAYLITQVTHLYSADGFKTIFHVRGSRCGLMLEDMQRSPEIQRWPGVVTAMVTNTDDPKGWGRVKVKYPWMAEDAESDWARLSVVGGGPNAGVAAIPEVGDEVLLAFAHGNFGQPFVLGGLWNGQHKLPVPVSNAASSEKPKVQTWCSRKGHCLTIYDDARDKIEIVTAGGSTIVMDDSQNKITIHSRGDVDLTAGGNMKVNANGNFDLAASGTVTIKGTMINLN